MLICVYDWMSAVIMKWVKGKTNKKCGLNYLILEIEVFDYLYTQIYGIKPTLYK